MDAVRRLILGSRGLPLAWTLRDYDRSDLPRDVVAGLTVAALIVPLSIGYAQVAGLPPEMGLYASLAPLAMYALLGSARRVVIGPDAATAALIGATIAPLAVATDERVRLAGALALMVGLVFVVMRLAALGFLANLLSKPILIGYLTGVGVDVAIGQIPKLLGARPLEAVMDVLGGAVATGVQLGVVLEAVVLALQIGSISWPSLVVGLLVIATIVVGGRLLPRVPMALVAIIGALVASAAFDLAARGVQVLGPVAGGLPPIGIPYLSTAEAAALLPGALGLAVLSFADTTATGRTFSEKHGEETDPERELVALAGADIANSLTGGYPVSASPSRTAASENAGSRTQLVGLVAAATVLVVLLFLTGPMAYLPTPALAGVILVSAVGLIDVRAIWALLQRRMSEGIIAVAAALGVILYGTLVGVVIAVLLATINVFRRAASPPIVELGREPMSGEYLDLSRWSDATRVPGILLLRHSGPLFFANIGALRDAVTEGLATRPDARGVVIDMRTVADIDLTAVDGLRQLMEKLAQAGFALALARPTGPVRDELRAGGLGDLVGPEGQPAGGIGDAISRLAAAHDSGGTSTSDGHGAEIPTEPEVAPEAGTAAGPTPATPATPVAAPGRPAAAGGPTDGRRLALRLAVALAASASVVVLGIVLLRDPDGRDATPTPAAAVGVPNIVGMSESRAREVVERAGLVYGQPVYVSLPDRPEDTVVDQSPTAGTSVVGGSTVEAVVATGREIVAVPDVRGLPEAEAVVALTTSGLRIDAVEKVGDSEVGAGLAVGTDPPAGTRLTDGSSVVLLVSTGGAGSTAAPASPP